MRASFVYLSVLVLWSTCSLVALCQLPAPEPTKDGPVVFTTQQDHQNMLQQLGITKLRPGRDADQNSPRAANYEEALANPFPALPGLLQLNNGELVEAPNAWWEKRRPEIVELLEREVYGRIPDVVPGVAWEVRESREIEVGGKAAVQKHIVGVVDNSSCAEIEVHISMSLTLPKDASEPVPVLMSFGWTPFDPSPFGPMRGPANAAGANANSAPRPPTKEDLLIAAGWGAVTINPSTIQADSGGWQARRFGPASNNDADAQPVGAGLTRGIIGLTNRGQPRKPDQWGALRAWGWGASRGLDYLETVPEVDARRVGIAGVSRFGKAALVTMAFDPRFAAGLIASSGKGGTVLYRRNFGESLENLASSGAYHWMAGNFLKYASAEGSFANMTANDLPIDSHMTLALCAPRLTFISHGIPEKGDAQWLDHQGSFMAAIAAQPVFRLLGARDLGRSDEYRVETMPAVNVGLMDGALAWRQHDGGHTDGPNVEHFIRWADEQWKRASSKEPSIPKVPHLPIQRDDKTSQAAHQQLLEKTRQGRIDVYFQGDSITRRWGATDYPGLLAHWRHSFHGWNAANFGWGGDTTHHILWRMQNGELDGVSPKVIVLQAGTNNLPWEGHADQKCIDDVCEGIAAILHEFQQRTPQATILLTAIFPRPQNPSLAPAIDTINHRLQSLTDNKRVRWLNINDSLVDSEGRFRDGMSSDGIHLEKSGYEVWASALKPLLTEILGPPSADDLAPPATGIP